MITNQISNSELTDLIEYSPHREELTIHFLDTDTTWRYYDISEHTYINLIISSSLGEFFNREIRNNYRCERINVMPA